MQPASDNAVGARGAGALWVLAFVTAALFGIHGLAYWDAGDYVRLSIAGGQSGLLLGRPLFLFVSRRIVSAGVDPASSEVVLRWFWTAVSAIAAPALAVLGAHLGLSRRASIAAGIALALSPSFAHSAHQVMTDAPALAMTICALIAAASGQAIVAGVLMAVAILTRETAAIHLIAMVLLLAWPASTQPRVFRPRGALVALAITAVGIALTLAAFPPPSFGEWVHAMSRSVQTHPVTLWQIVAPFLWILSAGPVPVVIGAYILLRRRDSLPSSRLLAVSVPAAIGTVFLLFYPDGSYSPRYMLATVPLAFFLPAAQWIADRQRAMGVAFALPLVILYVSMTYPRAVEVRGATVIDRIALLPQKTLVVPGHFCPQARLGATIHQRPDLSMMCPGWEWSDDPAGVLDEALLEGRPVAVDIRDDAWLGQREVPYRDAIRAWATRHSGQDLSGFVVVTK
jgi:hypothetical protein